MCFAMCNVLFAFLLLLMISGVPCNWHNNFVAAVHKRKQEIAAMVAIVSTEGFRCGHKAMLKYDRVSRSDMVLEGQP